MNHVAGPERRVVIVDHSRTIQAILDNAFGTRKDFGVVGFSSDASSAAEMIRQLSPDIVTIDLYMPHIDGAALLDMIGDLGHVCKIIVSDQAARNVALTAKLRNAGASACLDKRDLVDNPTSFFEQINSAYHAFQETRHKWHRADAATTTVAPPLADPVLPAKLSRPPFPVDENRRLDTVRRKALGNAVHERQFDLVTRHMAQAAEFPMCLLTFIDDDTQWIKSAHGIDVTSTPRSDAFCTYTIGQGGWFVVSNALRDERFAANPLVVGAPYIRTYAAHPIVIGDGTRLGALCLIDVKPRTVSHAVLTQLAGMAEIVAEMIEQRPVLAA